ncbi:isoaspartyl peptidase/L-asparaginase-like isoform X2 [Dendropsophus ebraccatus]|uniref:isoaspartyl peptidase/L-asparaginase-like isoform X2 n=1 Tax=Dendropsophus ebraccatus TaxID=150705 RepID=UPI003831AE42
MDTRPVIVVHGGAWAIPDDLAERSKIGVKNAATCGFSILANGGSSLQAVEAAVRILEDDTAFDAGHGAVLNADGDVELDAIIMDGKNLAVGAVSCIKNIANPVMFARTVMEQTPHVMLTGTGANKFAEKIKFEKTPTRELVTENAVKEWEQYQKYKQSVTSLFNTERMHDTVGAVAIDSKGNTACATSTGGITNKMVGRVGDSPIIGETPERAADQALEYMKNKVHGRGGLIVVSKSGEWAARFTTKRMAWASVENRILNYGLNPGEKFQEKLDL